MLTQDDLKTLSADFPEDTVSVKVQSLSRDKSKAMLVLYAAHTDVYSRLEQVDPSWSSEVTASSLEGGADGYFSVRVKLTLKGVSRENTGEGQDPKSAISDALKRAAMLFGVGRYLYDTELVWVPYSESKDKFRVFTIAEYRAASRNSKLPPKVPEPILPKGPAPLVPKAAITPVAPIPAPLAAPQATTTPSGFEGSRASLGKQILADAKAHGLTDADLREYAYAVSGKSLLKEMTVEEMTLMLEQMRQDLMQEAQPQEHLPYE